MQKQRTFLFSKVATVPLKPHIQGELEVKQKKHAAHHYSTPSSVEVNNSLGNTSNPAYAFFRWSLMKHRD